MKGLALAIVLAMVGLSPVLAKTDEYRILTFGCSDRVVVGRVKNGDFHPVIDPDDFLGHGWIDAELKVKRVVKGTKIGPKLQVRYFAHTYMRDDRDFMFVLTSQPDGKLLIRKGQLMSMHPRLAGQCN